MKKQTLLLAIASVFALSGTAHAALDASALTGAVDATSIVAAITAIAAIKILPGVARWGYNTVISWFR